MAEKPNNFISFNMLILLIVIAILVGSIIGLIEVKAYDKSRDSRDKKEGGQIQSSLEKYFAKNHHYPANLSNLGLASSLNLADFTYTPYNSYKTYTLSFNLDNQSDSGKYIIGSSPNKIYELTNEH
jgi:hypothetical protein